MFRSYTVYVNIEAEIGESVIHRVIPEVKRRKKREKERAKRSMIEGKEALERKRGSE